MKKTAWIFVLLIQCAAAFSQHQDARLWASLSVRYDPGKKWKMCLEEEARFYENISQLDKLNTELSINYQFNKILDVGILYRLIANNNPGRRSDFNNRFGVSMGIQNTFSRWTTTLKASFQKTYPEFGHSGDWFLAENYVRALAEVSKELKNKKTEPYTSIEFWYRMPVGSQAFIDQLRYTLGIQYKLNKRNRLDFYYRIQHEIQVKDPLTAHILGIGYRYTIR